MAFDGIRRELRQLRADRPGRRFERGHERQRADKRALRWFLIGLGIFLIFAGALTFWIPGPNFLIVFVGLALVAAQWRFVARQLDRGEVVAREWKAKHWEPYPHKRRVLLAAWLTFATVVATLVWVADQQGLLPGWFPFL